MIPGGCAISERCDSNARVDTMLGTPDFFEYINEGWLDMYYEPPSDEV